MDVVKEMFIELVTRYPKHRLEKDDIRKAYTFWKESMHQVDRKNALENLTFYLDLKVKTDPKYTHMLSNYLMKRAYDKNFLYKLQQQLIEYNQF